MSSSEELVVSCGKRSWSALSVENNMQRVTAGNQSFRLLSNNLVLELNRTFAECFDPSFDGQHVVIAGGSVIPALDLCHCEVSTIFPFEVAIGKSSLPAEFCSPHFKPDQVVGVVDKAHLVRFGVANTNLRGNPGSWVTGRCC